MSDKLVCRTCASAFMLEEDERILYERMGFERMPERCKVCRGSDKALKAAVKPEREMYTAICDACGKETQLPFKPKGDKPVYCKACFTARGKA